MGLFDRKPAKVRGTFTYTTFYDPHPHSTGSGRFMLTGVVSAPGIAPVASEALSDWNGKWSKLQPGDTIPAIVDPSDPSSMRDPVEGASPRECEGPRQGSCRAGGPGRARDRRSGRRGRRHRVVRGRPADGGDDAGTGGLRAGGRRDRRCAAGCGRRNPFDAERPRGCAGDRPAPGSDDDAAGAGDRGPPRRAPAEPGNRAADGRWQ